MLARSMLARPRAALVAIVLATIVGGTLRLGTVGWGMPLVLHVDEKGFVMWEAIATEWRGLVQGDYRPDSSTYGPLVFGLAVVVKWAMYGGPDEARPIAERFATAGEYHRASFDAAVAPGAPYSLADWTLRMRTISALLGTLAILLLARAAWRLAGPTAGAVAALITAMAPGLVQVSHFYTSDALVVPEIAMLADACVLLLCGGGTGAMAYAAVALGLIALTKMPGVLVGLAIPFSIAWARSPALPPAGTRPWQRRLMRSLRASVAARTFAIVLGAGAVFALAQPWLFDGRGLPTGDGNTNGLWVLASFFQEREFPWHDWRFTYNDQLPFLYWLVTIFPYALGGPVAIAGYLGVLRAWSHDIPSRLCARLALPSFLLIGGWATMTIRHGLPVVPGLVLSASLVLSRALSRGEWWQRALATGSLVWLTVYGLAWAAMFVEEDPRILSGRWLAAHADDGDVVVVDPESSYTAVLGDNAEWIGVPDFEMPRLSARRLWSTFPANDLASEHAAEMLRGARFVVVGDFYRRRAVHFSAATRAPEHARFYADLFDGRTEFALAAHFDRRPHLGPIWFDEESAETLSVDFDHMPVWIFERRSTGRPAP